MKLLSTIVLALTVVGSGTALADEKTEQEVLKTILESNAYTKSTNKGRAEHYSKEGAVEFWSSGGMMQEVSADDAAGEFDEYRAQPRPR